VRLVYVNTFAVVFGGLFVVLTAVIAVVTKQNEEPVKNVGCNYEELMLLPPKS